MEKNPKKPKAVAFVDMSNIFHGSKNYAKWPIDYKKTEKYLENRHTLTFFRLYGCEDTNPSTEEFRKKAVKQQGFYAKLAKLGLDVFKKPLQHIDGKTKGDVDNEIKEAMRQHMLIEDVEDIILFSGDKHFLPVIKECCNKGKYLHIYSFRKTLSGKIRDFCLNNPKKCKIYMLDKKRKDLEKTRLS